MAVSFERAANTKQKRGDRNARAFAARKIEDESPQRERGGKKISMGQRALREPHWIERRKQRGCRRDRRLAGDSLGQAVDPEQRERCHDQLSQTRGQRAEAGEFPPERKVDRGQRRMGVR